MYNLLARIVATYRIFCAKQFILVRFTIDGDDLTTFTTVCTRLDERNNAVVLYAAAKTMKERIENEP